MLLNSIPPAKDRFTTYLHAAEAPIGGEPRDLPGPPGLSTISRFDQAGSGVFVPANDLRSYWARVEIAMRFQLLI
jgi:hypothetical protein